MFTEFVWGVQCETLEEPDPSSWVYLWTRKRGFSLMVALVRIERCCRLSRMRFETVVASFSIH